MALIETYASEHALHTIQLKRIDPDDEIDRDATNELLAAVSDLANGWLVPLGIGLVVDCCDPQNFLETTASVSPPNPHWFLRVPSLDPRLSISTGYSDPIEEVSSQLDAATVAGWVDRALDQKCSLDGHLVAFTEMTWTIVRLLIPVQQQIGVRYAGGSVTSVIETIEDDQWALGPVLGPVGPPARLRAVNDHGSLRIHLSLLWDLWIDRPEGRALVERGVSRVLNRGGWRLE